MLLKDAEAIVALASTPGSNTDVGWIDRGGYHAGIEATRFQ